MEQNWFPLGNCVVTCPDTLLARKNGGDTIRDNYESTKDKPLVGMYGPMGTPVLMVNDLEIAKRVLVKNFDHFVDRFVHFDLFGAKSNNLTDELWNMQMASLHGSQWKQVRSTFSPMFTSAKLKMMVPLMAQVSRAMEQEMEQASIDGTRVDVKDMMSRLSLDTIASCIFGLDAKTMTEEHSEFITNVSNILHRSPRDVMMFASAMIPGLGNLLSFLNVPFFKPKETQFIWSIMTKTMEHRLKSSSRIDQPKRNDMIDLIIEALAPLGNNNNKSHEKDPTLDEMDKKVVVAAALVMFIAGYETTAATMAFVVYELAMNPIVQKKLQEEVDQACEGLDPEELPSFSAVQEMEYLSAVLHETMRRHTIVGVIPRGCIKDFRIPGTDIVIEKGTDIEIPAAGIHMDPDIYPDPEEFRPERFLKEAKVKRHPMSFQGFGQGPRNCIGLRFFLVDAKICLVRVLKKFSIMKSDQTPSEIELDPRTILCNPKEPIFLRIERRRERLE